jgi:pimeloyl-ACP methyl ester carboxylesterase
MARPLRAPLDLGRGPAIVLLPGFGLPPSVYARTARLLARRARVIVPELYRVRGRWHHDDIVDRLAATLDALGLDRVTIIGHSFAGSIELSYAVQHPERIDELVFADTLAVSRQWPLAEEAARHPLRLLWLATPQVAAAFGRTAATHPMQLAQAGWYGFKSGRAVAARRVAELGIPAHVLWANRDSLLSRNDGREFARNMQATFTLATSPLGAVVDHDWMYRQPELFVRHLDNLGLDALRG